MEQKINTSPIPFRNHTALLLSTSLPYLQPTYRAPVELAMKFLEFTETLHTINIFSPFSKDISKDNKEAGLFGLINTFILDIEGLLNSLSAVCTGDEKEIIGMFLNIIRIKNFYETYNDLTKMPMMFSPNFNHSPICEPTSNETQESDLQTSEYQNTSSEKEVSTNLIESFPNIPFCPSDLTSMLNDEQKETLDLLKTLFSEET